MIKLLAVQLYKYKSIETEQQFGVEPAFTTLVGKNEAGKTAILEAIAKSNYFEKDDDWVFDATYDYPRREKKKFDKSNGDVTVITCTYELPSDLLERIQEDVGKKAFSKKTFTHSMQYRSPVSIFGDIDVDIDAFFTHWFKTYEITNKDIKNRLKALNNQSEIEVLLSNEEETFQPYADALNDLRGKFENKSNWDNPLSEYVMRVWIEPVMPKFVYYDEYYNLPARVDIKELENKGGITESLKTANALFELADINTEELLNDYDYEPYIAELEATSNEITSTLFEYWKTNANLRVQFSIKKEIHNEKTPQQEIRPILHIRVWNDKYKMSLSLDKRSKGFNWFFSFIVWFSKIQETKDRNYILLLDEPGLNLHATAQADLLRFITDLAKDYQVIYTTHSPFMIPDDYSKVRTVFEADDGTQISDSIDERDPDTLFPLQAALGYDIAQNLFIAPKNLLVEGTSDLIFLDTMSTVLQNAGRTGLRDDVTIVPVGGSDKVTTFISLLRGQKLQIACLLDTFTDQKGKQRITDLIRDKIIREKNVRFFDEFADNGGGIADLEDMFEKGEYVKWFNEAFTEHTDITVSTLDAKEHRIILQINSKLGIKRFNHHRPANILAKSAPEAKDFSAGTLDRFEKAFETINKLF